MFSSPFLRRLFLPYLLLICVAVGVVGGVGAQRLRVSYLERTRRSLSDEIQLIASQLRVDLRADHAAELNVQVREVGQLIDRRITVIKNDGTVIADNEADPARMDNHRLRPEIVSAAKQPEGQSVRHSGTVHADLMYFARQIEGADGRPYFLRISVHLRELDRHLRAFYASIALTACLAIVVAAMISYFFARRSVLPLVELTCFADALREGDLSRRTLRKEGGEIGRLAAALNSMADSLCQLIAQTHQDKSQLLAVLSSMGEGVIATDTREKIVLSNAAAVRLLDFTNPPSSETFLSERIRSQPILDAASDVLRNGQRRSIQVGPIAGRYLEVTICTFPTSDGEEPAPLPEGLVLVMHDTTESFRYQELRKEFVANVSHELRTPLTAIKGFAETLRDGALYDPVRGPQYLTTIEKHADQLTNLVNDLLELSRLESLPGLPRVLVVDVRQVVRKAVDLLRPAAEKKSQTLDLKVEQELPMVNGNPDYLERGVANLLENAVKYTPEGGHIAVTTSSDLTHVVIEVTDNGIGIPAAELPRIFERFYRVDRSRSRDMGGTGLGLSIVKHIAQAHRGSIHVQSTLGAGAAFQMRLPATLKK